MLKELHIQDFAIIDDVNLTLESGFNVLTGETGAGKSILIDAVLLLLGGRADTTAVRTGASRALIEGLFLLDSAERGALISLLEQEGLESDNPDELWLSRELRENGRSVARVNGAMVAVSVLREISERLVDLHGQSEHLSLLRVNEHLNLLDRFAGLEAPRAALADVVRQLHGVRRELTALRQGEQQRMQRLDLLRFQVQEIVDAAPKSGEIVELEDELTRLANAEQLHALATQLLILLQEGAEDTPAILDLLGQAQRDMRGLVHLDATLQPQAQALGDVSYQVEDVAQVVRSYLTSIEFSPKRLAQVEQRLSLLRHLERKYGGALEQVLEHAQQAAAELQTLEHSDERLVELESAEARYLMEASMLAEQLSQQRRNAARQLAAGIEAELADLHMTGAHFGVAFRCAAHSQGAPLSVPLPADVWVLSESESPQDSTSVQTAALDATGVERVEFLIAPNVGEGLKPMMRIASGGETARLMLALKTVLSRVDRTPTLIFDEIDQGIGGRVGAVVGAKLWQLTVSAGAGDPHHQVLCITHLPQLASFGDAHYQVQKQVVAGRTLTRVTRLEGDARVAELAQMLGTQGEAARQGAQELLAQAVQLKQ